MHRYGRPPDRRPFPVGRRTAPGGPSKAEPGASAASGAVGAALTSAHGTLSRHSNFCRRVWRPAFKAAGLSPVHFHDLRHSRNQLAADAGASLRELMDRMGHSTTRAAMVYHGSDERQQVIADALSKRAARELGRSKTGHRARNGHDGRVALREHQQLVRA